MLIVGLLAIAAGVYLYVREERQNREERLLALLDRLVSVLERKAPGETTEASVLDREGEAGLLPTDDGHGSDLLAEVARLEADGLDAEAIARRLGRTQGEVEFALQLLRRRQR